MTVRRCIALLCVPLFTTGVAGCASAVSTSAFKGEQQQVAQTVAHLQSHATGLEAKKVCGEDLASANVARLSTATGGCKKAVETQLKQIDNFETTVESVQVSGDKALAHVKSIYSGKSAIQTLTLVKERGKWRISGTVGFLVVPKAGAAG
jgi:hypothetical protein